MQDLETDVTACAEVVWDEAARVEALQRYRILDTPKESFFEEIAKLAAEVCDTPIAVVNFVGEDRQWFKAEVGIGQRELPLDVSICRHALLQRGLFVVPDLARDDRFIDNPLVQTAEGLRFYAGALLESSEGLPIGTMCVLDTKPRPQGLAEIEARFLKNLARQVMSELEMRRALVERDLEIERSQKAEARLRESETRLHLALSAAGAVAWQWDFQTQIIRWGNVDAIREIAGADVEETMSFEDWLKRIHPDDVERHQAEGAAAIKAGEGMVTYRLCSNGETKWLQAAGKAIAFSPQGHPLVMTGITQDITERKRREIALAESEARLHATYSHALVGIAEVDRDGRFLRANEKFYEIAGYSAEELLQLTFFDITHDDDLGEDRSLFEELWKGGIDGYQRHKRYVRPDGSVVWIELAASIVRGSDGAETYGVRVVRDITEEKRAQEHQLLLVNELNHRVKNTLAVVQSVARQTFRKKEVPEELVQSFEGRLAALSRAHNVLTEQNWEATTLSALVARSLEPFESSDRTLTASGPDVTILPQTAVSLALALHELATNAVKYGALSRNGGEVRVSWVVEAARLTWTWEERGGPPVSPPTHQGFGSRMLQRALANELGGKVELDFHQAGLVCRLEAPIPPRAPT